MKHELICGDCLSFLLHTDKIWDCIFADPVDNIGLGYNEYSDTLRDGEYIRLLNDWLNIMVRHAKTVWVSYNAKWTFQMGRIVVQLLNNNVGLEAKHCIQVITFGQHNQHDLGNNHRPLLRIRRSDAPLYPDQIRIPSWRQEHGDKRADPRGRVPGDVFDFPRVTGNSKQRRKWCPTQLAEGLVERCVKLCTKEGDTVLDPFAGTGTTLRVCKQIKRVCTLIEIDQSYCDEIGKEHNLEVQIGI